MAGHVQRVIISGPSTGAVRASLAGGAVVRSDLGIVKGVAADVTDDELARLLLSLGCPLVQGYHLGRPAPRNQAELALEKNLVAAGLLPGREPSAPAALVRSTGR
jgi:predicted signal transduction protein with EAL and GGDEF domain